MPDRGALEAIAARLEAARLLTTQVFVRVPRYRAVNVLVTAAGDPVDPAAMADVARRALALHLDAVAGGNEGNGWPFGHPLRPSELVRVVQDVLGGAAMVSSVAVALDGAVASESCRDVPIGPHDLVYLDSCRVTLQRNVSRAGVL
jgi:hypothetical protein